MKKLLLFLLTLFITTDLFARMNPFEPTDTFYEQQQEYLKKEQIEAQLREEEIQREAELLAQKEAQKEAEILAQQEALRKIEEQKVALAIKEAQEKKLLIKKDTHKILPFVRLEVLEGVLNIYIDKRYSLINQDILEESNKFLFDFRATESFYTVRKALQDTNFKSVAVGTHLDKNFFRVVVELTNEVTKYKETIDNKNNIISIKKIK